MQHLLKSKLGLVAAILYLLFAFALLGVVLFAGDGPHGEAGTAFIYFFLAMLPLSALVFSTSTYFDSTPPNPLVGILIYVGLLVCAFVNAAIIYLIVGFISKLAGGTQRQL